MAFAGHGTTSVSIMYTLYALAAHPTAQARVQEELDEVFGCDGSDVTADDVSRLPYLSSCIKESMRLYSTVPSISRQSEHDLTFKTAAAESANYVIPANVEIVPFLFLHHRDPKWFPEPKKFDPERFGPNAPQRHHPFAFVPFSAGARNCIGQKFAELEQKVVLATILRKYSVRTDLGMEELDDGVSVALTLNNRTGLPIYFDLRT